MSQNYVLRSAVQLHCKGTAVPDIDDKPGVIELLDRYEKWRRIFSYSGKAPPDIPDSEGGRLYFRRGYPHPDWSAYVLERTPDDDYRVLHATTERLQTPVESSEGRFSRIQDAGKFIIYKTATSLMISCWMDPLSWKWHDAGPDPRVDARIESDRVVKYVLRSDPDAYCIMSLGDMPYSHILPLSYDELDALLLEDFPESVTSQLAAESR
ncbi:hypothetical protein LAUMK4_03019 [Mycobacterium persicum]|uniref:Uncharacterized protein n=1 Tax=Mycobacterium persicum TaxID=1487726 RepID=A0ABY6RJL5_9MYCO|nr:hypothetical protein LAUMK15_03345 [Mycobacterium persicum]VAZ95069.1 hypothetical protein LAUMK4_03019 [Mycobacterium persicum]